ncbi:hypothetical protein TYRP_006636 [Tyrophagus putrescentiae]|nr:hypothetical protein TYRP_006636 [Tyrophagus putrescentiae]
MSTVQLAVVPELTDKGKAVTGQTDSQTQTMAPGDATNAISIFQVLLFLLHLELDWLFAGQWRRE